MPRHVVCPFHESFDRILDYCCATIFNHDMLQRYAPFQCTLALLTCAALVLSLSACDSIGSFAEDGEDAPDVELGRFEMVMSGAMQDTLTGVAVFSTTVEEDSSGEEQTIFGLAFTPDTAEADVQANEFASQIVRASERPEEGDYTFAEVDGNSFPDDVFAFPDDVFAFSFLTETPEHTAIVTSDGGTLEITGSSSTSLSGRFEVETSGFYYEPGMDEQQTEASITIEGKFRALGGELAEGTL
jgi:hypothetical protein